MKKILLWLLVIVLSVTTFGVFSLASCKSEETVTEETATEEIATEESSELVEEEIVESDEEIVGPVRTTSGLPPVTNWTWVEFDPGEIASKNYKIGYSTMTLDHPYRAAQNDTLHAYAEEIGVEAITVNSEWDTAREVSNVESLIAMGCDGIIISSHAGLGIKPAVDACAEAGIPVLLFDGGKPESDWVFGAWASTDDWHTSRRAGHYAAILLNGSGKIGVIQGAPGSTPQIGRTDGFYSALDDWPDVEIVMELNGKWLREPAIEATENMMQAHPEIDLIFSQNDEMCIGTAIVIERLGRNTGDDKVFVLSGGDNQSSIYPYIKSGTVNLTQLYEYDGAIAINTILQLLEGMDVPKFIRLDTNWVTPDNVDECTPAYEG